MIDARSYTLEHIEGLRKGTRVDRQILERSIFALGLLEALVRVGTPMRFKGGSSLMLLLEEPMRLSTDIDVVVPLGTDMMGYLAEAARIFPFKRMEEQVRKGRNGIVKRHFKFYYDSPVTGGEFHILLDVLFEDDHYARIVVKPIASKLLLANGPAVQIEMPTADCILGDKLTAFAPHTTGIPLGIGKDLEVVKQMYDVATLAGVLGNLDDATRTFDATVASEAAYRGIEATRDDVLIDCIEAAACVAGRGRYDSSEYPLYLGGIRSIVNHIFGERFSAERAVRSACVVMHVAASVLVRASTYESISDPQSYLDTPLTGMKYAKLSRIRKQDAEAYAHLVVATTLLE